MVWHPFSDRLLKSFLVRVFVIQDTQLTMFLFQTIIILTATYAQLGDNVFHQRTGVIFERG